MGWNQARESSDPAGKAPILRDLLLTATCGLACFVIMVMGMIVSFVIGVFISAIFVDVSRDLSRALMYVVMIFGTGGSLALCVKSRPHIMRFFSGWSI